MSARDPHIKLRPATLRGVERKKALERVSLRGEGCRAWVHSTPSAAKVYRVGEDAIVISDGGAGYLPFSLTALEEVVAQARELPILKGRLILP